MNKKEELKNKRGLKTVNHLSRIRFRRREMENFSVMHSERIASLDFFDFNDNIDSPYKIIDTYLNSDNRLLFKIEFFERKDGIIPDSKILSSEYLKKKYPEFLIEFYESVIMNSLKKD